MNFVVSHLIPLLFLLLIWCYYVNMSISVLNLINLKKLIKFYFRYNIIRKDIYNILFLIKKKIKKTKLKFVE